MNQLNKIYSPIGVFCHIFTEPNEYYFMRFCKNVLLRFKKKKSLNFLQPFICLLGTETYVTDIPKDVINLSLSLTADVDIDLQLYSGDSVNKGDCLVGYGCQLDSADTQKIGQMTVAFRYHFPCTKNNNFLLNSVRADNLYFLSFFFSGDDRETPVTETISIDKTDRDLVLFVRAFNTGVGHVSFSWDGIDPCPQDLAGCSPCETYDSCKHFHTILDIYISTFP